MKLIITLFVVIFSYNKKGYIKNCKINGYNLGRCVKKQEVINDIQFCQNSIADQICAPNNVIGWPNDTIKSRDRTIYSLFIKDIEKKLINEFSNNAINLSLQSNDNCYKAFKKFLCAWNFPKCDETTKETLPICDQFCFDFLKKCQYDEKQCYLKYGKLYPGLNSNLSLCF